MPLLQAFAHPAHGCVARLHRRSVQKRPNLLLSAFIGSLTTVFRAVVHAPPRLCLPSAAPTFFSALTARGCRFPWCSQQTE